MRIDSSPTPGAGTTIVPHDGQRARVCAELYGFFAAALEYPDRELLALVRSGAVAARLRTLLETVCPALAATIDAAALGDAGSGDELAIEYTRLFDACGGGAPACCLNSSAGRGDARMAVLEELVRFYNHFGLTAADTPANELPDYLGTLLEFMYFLCEREAECREEGEDSGDFVRAQHDFLARHLAGWIPALHEDLKRHAAPRYYRELSRLGAAFVAEEAGRHAPTVR